MATLQETLSDLRALQKFAFDTSSPQVSISRDHLRDIADAMERMMRENARLAEMDKKIAIHASLDPQAFSETPSGVMSRDDYARTRQYHWPHNVLNAIRLGRKAMVEDAREEERRRAEKVREILDRAEAMEIVEFVERTPVTLDFCDVMPVFKGRSDVPVRLLTIQANNRVDPPTFRVRFVDLEFGDEHELVCKMKVVSEMMTHYAAVRASKRDRPAEGGQWKVLQGLKTATLHYLPPDSSQTACDLIIEHFVGPARDAEPTDHKCVNCHRIMLGENIRKTCKCEQCTAKRRLKG